MNSLGDGRGDPPDMNPDSAVYRTDSNRLDHGFGLLEPTLLFGKTYQRSVYDCCKNVYFLQTLIQVNLGYSGGA